MIAVLTLIVGLVWIGVTANAALRKSTVAPDVSAVLAPLDPNLDVNVFTKLAQRNVH